MKSSKLQLAATALFAGLMFSSCQKEDYKKDITPIGGGELSGEIQSLSVPLTDGLKVAIYGSANGEVAETIKKASIENYSLNMSNVQLLPSTGTLVMDIDDFNSQNEKIFWSYYDEAFKNNNAIIFESGSKNMKSITEFFNSQFGGTLTEGDIFAFGVYKYNADGRIICPMGKKFHYTADDILNEYFTSYTRYKFIAGSTMSDSETDTVTSSNLRVSSAADYTYTNITPETAAGRVISSPRRRIWNVKWTADPLYNGVATSSVIEEVIHDGAKHDATGKCKGQQTATFANGRSYTKKWSVGLSLVPFIPEKATSLLQRVAEKLALSVQMEKSETNGITDGDNLQMYKQYAQGLIVRRTADYEGKFIGSITFLVSEDIQRPRSYTVKINYTKDNANKQAKWHGIKPVWGSDDTFKWKEWGNDLLRCTQ